MKEITLKAYLASELKGKAQLRAIQDHCEINITEDWYQPVVEEFQRKMEDYGIEAATHFTGFWSQGDGACFISESLDTDTLVRRLHREGRPIPQDAVIYSGDYTLSIQKNNLGWHYDNENTVAAFCAEADECRIDEFTCRNLEDAVTDWVREESRSLYRELEKYYIELTSDKAILETLDANEYLFTQGGQLIPMS